MPPLRVLVHIYNSAGEEVYALPGDLGVWHPLCGVQSLDGPFVPDLGGSASFLLTGTGASFTWDGRNQNGQFVAGGTYSVVFQEPSAVGPPTLYTASATVIRTPSSSAIDIFNSAGEIVRHIPLNGTQPTSLDLAPSFVPDPNGPGLKISWGAGAADSTAWDGLNAQGQPVSSGVYRVSLVQQTPGAYSTVFSKDVTVIAAPSAPLDGLVVGPNPLRDADGGVIQLRLPGLQSGDPAHVGLYNLAGELVAQSAGFGPQQELWVPSSLAGGVYLVAVEAHNAGGVSARRVLRIAVVK
jgi:hypothetical protein